MESLLGVSLLFPNISHYLRKQGEVSLYEKNFHSPKTSSYKVPILRAQVLFFGFLLWPEF